MADPDQFDDFLEFMETHNPETDANAIIDEYMNGDLTVDQAVTQLTSPIEHAWTTLDNGLALHANEMIARNQRQYHDPEAAAKEWGVEQDFPSPTADDRQKETSEGLLWSLWFAVCHTSRKTPWENEQSQSKLVHLVRTIKARPDPPLPSNITPAVRKNWIWSSGTLWSDLIMLGPSARESYNDSPGCGWGMGPHEIYAWTNANAFFARLSVAGIADFWNYGIWALRDVLEDEPRGNERGSQAQCIDATLPAAAAWIHVGGRKAYDYVCRNERDFEVRYEVNEPLPKLGWQGAEVWTMARWVFWKEKFGVMAGRGKLAEGTRKTAADAARYMEEMESAKKE